MSVVACRVTNTGYEIAADSLIARGWTISKGDSERHSKLFSDGNVVIGGIGLCEGVALMELFLSTHKPSEPSSRALLEFISEFYDWRKKKTEAKTMDCDFIIGVDKKIFSVKDWFISEINKYHAIGAGDDFALAALYLGHTAKEAVEVATELSAFCEKPILVIER